MIDSNIALESTMPLRKHSRSKGGFGNGESAGPGDQMIALLHDAAERHASDVHLVPGYPVTYRIHGDLQMVSDAPLDPHHLEQMLRALVPERFAANVPPERSFDSSVAIVHEGQPCRFRANVYRAQESWCACLRHVPNDIPTFDWLGFPEDLAAKLVGYTNGLVVITGITGSGKSATLAALIAQLRRKEDCHVLTIEEPVEYLHAPGLGGIVTQREVGRDVLSFADGLKFGLRQDPDVILVGEIRDRETAQMALSAAETGHLIFTTLHTRDAKGALTRLVDLFPHESQDDIRTQLALSLRSVVSQHLLPAATPGDRRVLALEVLHNNQQTQVAIRAGKIETLESALQTGKRDGMFTLDDDLQRLVRLGKITPETARRFAKDPAVTFTASKNWN